MAKELEPRHLEAIYLQVYENYTVPKLAEHFKVDERTIYRWRAKSEYVRVLDLEIRKKLANIASEALAVSMDLMHNAQSESVRAAIAKDMISRGGYDAVAKTETSSTVKFVVGLNDEEEDNGNQDLIEEGTVQQQVLTLFDDVPE